MKDKYLIINKACSKCGVIKPLSKFGESKYYKSGFRARCKSCDSAYSRAWRRDNNDKYNSYQRKYKHKTKETSREKNKKTDALRRADPTVHKRRMASQKLNDAIDDGVTIRASKCSTSSSCVNEKIQGHHFDYDRPLDVIWLCANCHQRYHHGKMPEDDLLRIQINIMIENY